MSYTSSAPETIKAARTPHRCSWCDQPIEAGSSYRRWRFYGPDGPGVGRMHPECEDAYDEVSEDYDDGFAPGENPRGCNCGHSKGCPRCEARDAGGDRG